MTGLYYYTKKPDCFTIYLIKRSFQDLPEHHA